MVNALDAAINVLPLRIKTPLGPVRSDGGLLVATLTASPAELEEEQAGFYAVRAQVLAEGGDRHAAHDVVLGALREHPTSQSLRGWHGHELVLSGRYDDAADVFRTLADAASDGEVPMPPHIRALYLNNLAWSDLMTEDERLLPEAEDASSRAIEVLPAHPAVMGTRAFALICGGNLREGTQLGEKVFAKHRNAKDRATTAAVVAIGRAMDWRIPDAERWLATARGLDADCALLERASQELERRKASPNSSAELEGTWSSDKGRVAESG
jgi:predicted Zn-dependent protease